MINEVISERKEAFLLTGTAQSPRIIRFIADFFMLAFYQYLWIGAGILGLITLLPLTFTTNSIELFMEIFG